MPLVRISKTTHQLFHSHTSPGVNLDPSSSIDHKDGTVSIHLGDDTIRSLRNFFPNYTLEDAIIRLFSLVDHPTGAN